MILARELDATASIVVRWSLVAHDRPRIAGRLRRFAARVAFLV
jgi:hypothetical protein